MDHAVNRAVVSHEMSTDGRGSVIPAERSSLVGPLYGPVGRESRNASMQPSSWVEGCTGDMGVNDADDNGWMG
jgi:hypothetical protein